MAKNIDLYFSLLLQVLVGNSSGSKSLLRLGMDGAGFERPRPSFLAASILSIKFHEMVTSLASILKIFDF